MKKILLVLTISVCQIAFAQNDKGNWFIGASSSSFGFNSNTGLERTIDVSFTDFKDTLVADTDILNLAFLFPYTFQIQQDKNSLIDFNARAGYFVADNFLLGLGAGFSNENTVFKTKNDPAVVNASLDSLFGWFVQLPNVDYMGASYGLYYHDLYNLIASSNNNDLTLKRSMLKLAPFARYYIPVGQSAVFIDASYEYGSGKEEIKDDVNFTTNTMEHKHAKMNFGLGYELWVNDMFSIEPQFNYYMLNTETKVIEQEVQHPIILDFGDKSTERTNSNSGINFSIGLSVYL